LEWVANLGKLPAGDYTVTWIDEPRFYLMSGDPKQRRTRWSADEKPDGEGVKPNVTSFKLEASGP